ncbi:hypothetical protein [Cupriavidus numazuensis]|uniref:Lipoprotein n=1 Tax=Cupriavidus numazuensis TaxID=221992 RepID=A0ABM8TP43_9BURK|nr:hypothetical protein [Cupriavidus numazuensis]CAG2156803.1 hypothetical protein LMG26411_05370 [Cupriavidus numazuensis]
MTTLKHAARFARPVAMLSALTSLLLLGGCMNSTPRYDAQFGDALRTLRAMQTIDPNASANTDPVTGVDGRAATYAMDRYGQSFRNPPVESNPFVIGVGSGSNGSP